ncbi:MAG: hypothetical protein NZM41_00430 [Saprospiraceae bacterium]|nr:hypothetical protein [Saprospiraceae bacterium]
MRFLYHEMPAEEVARMKQRLATDPVLRAEFYELQQAKQTLPKVQFLPKSNTIHRILQYSTKTALEAQL